MIGTNWFTWWNISEARAHCCWSIVDAAFAVHPIMWGHSGGGLSLGRGFPIMSLTKQKLNTWSSTESEIVVADDFMLVICWTWYFMEAQGYHVQDNILFQDNNSFGKEWKGFKQQAYKAHQYLVFLYYQSHWQGWRIIGLVSDQRHDQRLLHDQTPTRCSVLEVQRPDHGSGSCTGSRTRKSQNKNWWVEYSHRQAYKRQGTQT